MHESPDQWRALSSIADAFGASVEVGAPAGSLYLVIGFETPPRSAVIATGGRPVSFLGATHLLALLPFEGFLALRRHPEVRMVGPVTIDPQRFARFVALIGANVEPGVTAEQEEEP